MKQKSLFLTIAVLLGLRITTIAQTPPSYVPTDGLVGWWPFNGNANDESGNGNNGTVNGATLTDDRFGGCNRAYEFDGLNSFITTDYSGVLGSNDRSISFWAKHVQVYDQNSCVSCSRQSVVSYGSNVTGPGQIGQGFYCEFNVGSTGVVFDGNETTASYSTPNDVSDNVWHHYVMVFDTVTDVTSVRVYQDGTLLSTPVFTYLPGVILNTTIGEDMEFGRRTYDSFSSTYYQGLLDDIGFWDRALTQDEITDLYGANLCFEYITVTDTLIINLGPTGFNPVTYSNTILMYPNPSNDQLTIDYGDYATLAGYTLKIFNSIGQEIHAANISQQQEVLPLGTWGGAGNYQVVIYNAQGVPVDTRTIVLQE